MLDLLWASPGLDGYAMHVKFIRFLILVICFFQGSIEFKGIESTDENVRKRTIGLRFTLEGIGLSVARFQASEWHEEGWIVDFCTEMVLTKTRQPALLPVSATGFADAAWPVGCHADLIASLKHAGLAVLGGDILKGTRRDLEHTFDSWSCDFTRKEAWRDYVARSAAEAVKYLAALPPQPDLWFTAEVAEKPEAPRPSKGPGR